MLTYFPKYLSTTAIAAYFAALLIVSVMYVQYAMQWYWMAMGVLCVCGFFLLSNHLTKEWHNYSPAYFKRTLFWWAFALRIAAVIFMYWFFTEMTGQPFMFHSADEGLYHATALYGHTLISDGNFRLLSAFEKYANLGLSDSGYPMWLSFVYWFTDDSVFLSRVVKAALSAWMCVLVYKLAARNFGDYIGRMAAIFCMLLPNLIYYCGVQLKETEMVFLAVAFIERADFVLRSRNFRGVQFALTLCLAGSLFFFRTVLGAAALLSFAVALLLTSERASKLSRRWLMLIMLALVGTYFVGGRIAMEVETYWEARNTNQSTSMEWRSEREGGNALAKYAGAAVFAPMIFTIPFPTIIETPGQENQRMLHGGNFIKNIMSGLCIFGLFMMIFKDGKLKRGFLKGPWREHILIEAILLSYLAILALSAFAHSERFHLPAVPFEMIFAAVGVSYLSKRQHKNLYLLWVVLMVVAAIGWSWFKLRGRGMA